MFGIYPHVQTFLRLIRYLKRQVGNVIAVSLTIASSNGKISDKAVSILGYVRGFVAWALLGVRRILIVDSGSQTW
jgi:hypothetical protein